MFEHTVEGHTGKITKINGVRPESKRLRGSGEPHGGSPKKKSGSQGDIQEKSIVKLSNRLCLSASWEPLDGSHVPPQVMPRERVRESHHAGSVTDERRP